MARSNFKNLLRSTNFQLAIVATSCILLAISTQSWYAAYSQKHIAHDILIDNSISIADSIGSAIAMYVYESNYAVIEDLISSYASLQDISAIQVSDETGQIISEVIHTPGQLPKPLYSKRTINLPDKLNTKIISNSEQISILHPVKFIKSNGWVKIDIMLQNTQQITWQIWKNALLVGLLAAFVSVLLFLHFSKKAVSSLRQAARFADNLKNKSGEQVNLNPFSLEMEKLENSLNSISTELKNQDMELQAHHNHLENLITARTQELEISNQELQSYSYSIAHDLRAPLRAISGFSSILQDDASSKLNNDELDYLQRIVTATHKMDKLIDGILDMSRVSNQELDIKKNNVSLIANDIRRLLAVQYQDEKILWKIQENLYGDCDEMLMGILLENLFSNACKFKSHDSISVIELFKWPDKSENVFAVRDNGIGFEMKYAEKIFHPFQQLNSKNTFEGEGIGLATVKRIIKRHKARIWVNSEPDKGSTFFFTLPPATATHDTGKPSVN